MRRMNVYVVPLLSVMGCSESGLPPVQTEQAGEQATEKGGYKVEIVAIQE